MTTPPPAEIVQEKSIQTSMTGNKNEPSPSTKGTEEALQAMAEERKKKNNSENVDFRDLAKEIGDTNGDDGEYSGDVNETEEIDVSEMMNDFPTIVESLNRTDTVSRDESNTSTPVRVEIVNNCTLVNGSTEHVIDYPQTNCKNTVEKSDYAKDNVVLKSFANTVCENVVDNKLILIPTGINDGREVVVFDDEILKDGVKKWQM
ncbi:hypothetical protein Tco_1423576, partial [Tanacetum coccineum]